MSVMLVATMASRLAPSVLFGHPELSPSAGLRSGRTLHHNFTFRETETLKTELSFSAKLHENAFHLDATSEQPHGIAHASLVDSIHCHDGLVDMRVKSHEDALKVARSLQPGVLLSGGRHWGCKHDSSGLVGSLQHRVVSQAQLRELSRGSYLVQVQIELIGLGSFFESAMVRFSTTRHPPPLSARHGASYNTKTSTTVAARHRTVRRRALAEDGRGLVPNGWFGDFFHAIWNGIKWLGNHVQAVVKTVAKVVTFLVTGTLKAEKGFSSNIISWNYDNVTHDAKGDVALSKDGKVQCKGCYANIGVGIHANLDIEQYEVKRVEQYVEGDIDFALGVHMDCDSSAQASEDLLLDTLSLPTITFYVGPVPITIDLSMPVHAGFTTSLQTSGKLGLSSGAHFHGKWGSVYTPQEGLTLLHEVENNVYANLLQMPNGKAEATVYLQPVIVMNIEYIGGPNFALKPFVEFGAVLDQMSACQGKLMASSNWGVQATIGAHIDIHIASKQIYEHNFPAMSIFSMKKKIATGCLVSQTERQLDDAAHSFDSVGQVCSVDASAPGAAVCSSDMGLQNNGMVVGTTWNGTIVKVGTAAKCSGYPPVQTLSCQIVESDYAGDLTFVCANNFAVYDSANVGHACTVTTGMEADYYSGSGQIIVEPKAGISDYSNCTTGAPTLPYGWSGTASAGLKQIDAFDSDMCSKIHLSRVPPAPPTPPGPGPSPTPAACSQYSGDERKCSQTQGLPCGWCIDDQYNAGCCAKNAAGTAVLDPPCHDEIGPQIQNCDKGWEPSPSMTLPSQRQPASPNDAR